MDQRKNEEKSRVCRWEAFLFAIPIVNRPTVVSENYILKKGRRLRYDSSVQKITPSVAYYDNVYIGIWNVHKYENLSDHVVSSREKRFVLNKDKEVAFPHKGDQVCCKYICDFDKCLWTQYSDHI